LLERDDEWVRLNELIDRAEAGAGGVVAVEGPAGIGKTRLIRSVRAEAAGRGLALASAVGGSLEQDFSFGVVRQLFEPMIAATPDPDQLFAGGAAAAAPLLGRRPAETHPDGDSPGAVLHGLYWLTVALTEARGPIALICDDAHWFDGPSLRFVAYLAGRVTELPVAIVVGTRPPVPGAEGELLRLLLAHQNVARLRLAPLSSDAVGEIVRSSLLGRPEPAFCDAVAKASNGNPFLVAEILRAAQTAGLSPDAASADRLAEIDAEASVLARIGRLPTSALEVARSVAVLGGDAHLRHIAAMTGLDHDAVGSAADLLLHADILGPQRPLAFIHPLVERAVYKELLPGDRSARHRAAVEALAAEGAAPDRIASHLMSIEPAGDAAATDVLVAAAQSAIAQGATDVAIGHLRRALREPPPPDRQLDIVLRLGAAESVLLDPGAIDHLGDAIERIGDPGVRLLLATARAAAQSMAGKPEDATADLRALEPELAGREALRLELLAAFGVIASTGPAAAPLVADEVAELVRSVAVDADAAPAVLGVRAYLGACVGEPAADVASLATRALSLVNENDPILPVWFHLPLCALVMADRDDEAAAIIDSRITAARRRGAPAQVGIVLFLRSMIALRAGDLDDAYTDASAVLDLATTYGMRHLEPAALSVLVEVLRERDDLGGAEALLDDFGYAEGDGDSVFHLFLLYARARLRGARRRYDEALADMSRGLERSLQAGIRSPGFIPWRAQLAFGMRLAGRIGEAESVAREALVEAEALDALRPRAEALRAVAMCQSDSGPELANEVASAFAALGARLEEARSLIAVARSIGIAGTPDEVRILGEALQLAERCGAKRLGAIASSTLRSLGVQKPMRQMTGLGALTAGERRVAALAVGRTNKEVAQELFVTVKTVETHLARTFQKLGISSRAELREALSV
jgi:DNA-binding NarL/FixJ family response regulator